MEKTILLLLLVGVSIAIIYLAKRLEQKECFKRVDRLIGIPIILLLLSWGFFEMVTGDASFFFINLKPLVNVTREQTPVLFWFYVFAKFFFAFLFAVRVKQLYGKKTT
jgi:hypothetical protein